MKGNTEGNTIKIFIGKVPGREFIYFVKSKFHKKPQPVSVADIGSVLYKLAKKILKTK